MDTARPKTETMNVTTARQQFSQLLNRVHQESVRVVIEKDGVPVAFLAPMIDLRRLYRDDEKREEVFRVIAEMSRGFEDVPEEELEREIEKAIAEVRAERRAARAARVA